MTVNGGHQGFAAAFFAFVFEGAVKIGQAGTFGGADTILDAGVADVREGLAIFTGEAVVVSARLGLADVAEAKRRSGDAR